MADIENQIREERESFARLYMNRDYKTLKNWLEEKVSAGIEKLLSKKKEETRGELAAELRAYRSVLKQVESAFKEVNKLPG